MAHCARRGYSIFVSRLFVFLFCLLSCSVRFVRNSVFSAATGYQCYGMLYFILMGQFRQFNITLQLTHSDMCYNFAKGGSGRRRVEWKIEIQKPNEFFERTFSACPVFHGCTRAFNAAKCFALEIEFTFVSFKLKYAFVWPQKCFPMFARENINNYLPSTCVCLRAKKWCRTKEWATRTHTHTMEWKWAQWVSEQNDANIMWPRPCRRLLLLLVVSKF